MTPFPSMRVDGAIALITGAGGGLGSLAARALSAAGADVVLVGRTRGKLDGIAQEVAAQGRKAHIVEADVTDSRSVAAMIEHVRAVCGGIDLLVNNAGVTSPKTLLDLSDEDWQRIIDTSATGTFYCTRAVAPLMIERKRGRIINMGSILSERGMANRTAYAAAKAAVANFTRASAFELGPHGITVNALAPTVIVTELNRELVKTQPQLYQAVVDRTPLGRLGQPEDIAGALVFLASPAAAFITGQVLCVDGGYTAG